MSKSAAAYFMSRAVMYASNPGTYGNETAAKTSPSAGNTGEGKEKDAMGRFLFVCNVSEVDGDCVVE